MRYEISSKLNSEGNLDYKIRVIEGTKPIHEKEVASLEKAFQIIQGFEGALIDYQRKLQSLSKQFD